MAEHAPESSAGDETGLASVDTVIGSVGSLDDLPVEEHVAVFEQAHEQLRRALDDAPAE